MPEGQRLVEDLYEGRRLIPDFDIPAEHLRHRQIRGGQRPHPLPGRAPPSGGWTCPNSRATIDWQQVKDAGAGFAILRLGWRGSTEGGLNLDTTFQQNYEGAAAAGLPVGVYFFSQAVTEEEAREEAAFTLDALEGKTITYPVVFDWEPPIPSDSLPAQDLRAYGMDGGPGEPVRPGLLRKSGGGGLHPLRVHQQDHGLRLLRSGAAGGTIPFGTRNTSPPPACTTTSTCGSTPTAPPCRASPGRRM